MPKKEHHQLQSLPGGSVVKNPLERPETWVQSPGQEDPPKKEMETHSKILAWKIPWTEDSVRGLQSMGSQESDMT